MVHVLEHVTINDVPVVRAVWWADKSDWGPGPWSEEPDKVQWLDPASDLDCLAVRHGDYGHWCAYVGVAQGHPLYGRHYNELPESLSVHGGVTFASACQKGKTDAQQEQVEQHGVCHIPEPGRPEQVWWLGFDCGHSRDSQPAVASLYASIGIPQALIDSLGPSNPWRTYRTLAYVMDECAHLAHQLAPGERRS